MSNIKRIFIEMDNLSDSQQLDLWQTLWDFADKKLPPETNLMCLVVPKKRKMAIINEWEKALKILDNANGTYGTKKALCRLCESTRYNSKYGIVHQPGCPIKMLRLIIAKKTLKTQNKEE